MAYVGTSLSVPFGSQGLVTDMPMTSIPVNAAIKANNISLTTSRLEKSKGSARYNPGYVLDAGIVSAIEWNPIPSVQRIIALTANGKAWRDVGDGSFAAQTPIATGLGALTPDAHMVTGGSEVAGNPKKLFIFTNGNQQVKVLSGDTSTVTNIATPSADWASGNYPTYGVVFQSFMVMMGCSASRHTLYFSRFNDHENYVGDVTQNPIFSVYPGEGDGIVAASVYKGNLFIFKKPYGVYVLNQNGVSDTSQWSIDKVTDAFGLASPHSFCQILDDFVAGNSSGGITSLQATASFGDVKAGDILTSANVEEYILSQTDPSGISAMHAIYYNERKKALYTARDRAGNPQNRIIVVDVAKQTPRITLETKDQPNCLFLRRDTFGVPRPAYGANDGYIYLMEQSTYNVGDAPYLAEWQTPYTDFAYADESLASKNKLFDFMELHYLNTGSWSLSVDVFIDNALSETIQINQSAGAGLGTFRLDFDRLSPEYTQVRRKPLHGSGRLISFRFYNNQLNQYFKIEKLVVGFRISAEQEKPLSGSYKV
jgi:hypothetical protein